jgi:hypothetical protein
MNNLRHLLFMILVGLSAAFLAQAQDRKDLPTRPFVENAPAYESWTISYAPDKSLMTGTSSEPMRILKEIIVLKFDHDWQEVSTWSNGDVIERWEYQGAFIFEQAGSPAPYVIGQGQLTPQLAQAYAVHLTSDFPELYWLSDRSYAGVKNYRGRDCLWFALPPQNPTSGSSAPAPPLMQAWIDLRTRLPIEADDGMKTGVYSFRSIPAQPAILPPRFATAYRR